MTFDKLIDFAIVQFFYVHLYTKKYVILKKLSKNLLLHLCVLSTLTRNSQLLNESVLTLLEK